MWTIIFKKIFLNILVICTIIILVTSIIYLTPVDPSRLSFGQLADASTVELKRAEMGLDKPLYVQLLFVLRDYSPINFIHKNETVVKKFSCIKKIYIKDYWLILKWPYFRISYSTGRDVYKILANAIPSTIILAFSSIIFASIIGIFLGIFSAIKRNTIWDKIMIIISTVGYSLPSYAAAIIITYIFAYLLKSTFGFNLTGSLFEINNNGESIIILKNLILPTIALGIRPVSIITQLTRSAILDTLSQPFIETLISKGLSKNAILFKHALKNALNPIVTGISGWFASLITGAFFVESVFGFNGLGQITVKALLEFDIPVILGSIIFTCIAFVVINIVVDILYIVVDPRMRKETL